MKFSLPSSFFQRKIYSQPVVQPQSTAPKVPDNLSWSPKTSNIPDIQDVTMEIQGKTSRGRGRSRRGR